MPPLSEGRVASLASLFEMPDAWPPTLEVEGLLEPASAEARQVPDTQT
jgi:hypothetical protein